MKYNEPHRLLKKAGCYALDNQEAGLPIWHSPKTGKKFTTSNHDTAEVATGTLKNIKRLVGI